MCGCCRFLGRQEDVEQHPDQTAFMDEFRNRGPEQASFELPFERHSVFLRYELVTRVFSMANEGYEFKGREERRHLLNKSRREFSHRRRVRYAPQESKDGPRH